MKNSFPEKMQAVFLTEDGNKLITRFVLLPKPGPGEVLVKIAAAPINPSDLARIRNIADPEERITFIPGIEGSGTVVDSGPGLIPRLWKGRRVACTTSHGHGGTWAEYMLTRAMSCIPLPDGMTFEQGSMLLVNPLTAVAFFNMIKAGGHKAIINTAAASSLGRMIDILGKKRHIRVIHIIRNEKQEKLLIERGALHILNSTAMSFEEDLSLLAGKFKITLAFDAVGGELTRRMMMAMPFGSTIVIYGNLSGEQPEMDHRSLVMNDKKVAGFYLGNWLQKQKLFTTVRCLLQVRKLLKDEVSVPVQAGFSLNHVQQAIDTYLSDMTAGKVLLIPDQRENDSKMQC